MLVSLLKNPSSLFVELLYSFLSINRFIDIHIFKEIFLQRFYRNKFTASLTMPVTTELASFLDI